MYLSDIFTVTVNLAGLPGLSLPCGVTGSGLPIGLQIIGKPFDEETVFRLAAAIEPAVDFRSRRPRLPEQATSGR
jgi:aspartyl-tRNA(Asn)/glutamyl-tRNA(Gln) amidotransferase subunit A